MALDTMAQELVTETMTALQNAPFKRQNTEILISPRRMRAMILFSQQRMQVMFNGKMLVLVEDSEAPELDVAIEAALSAPEPPLPEPVLPPNTSHTAGGFSKSSKLGNGRKRR